MKIQVEPLQEQRIESYDTVNAGNENLVQSFSDEEKFLHIIRLLDFSSKQKFVSSSKPSLESTPSLYSEHLIQIRNKWTNKVVDSLREAMGEVGQLKLLAGDLASTYTGTVPETDTNRYLKLQDLPVLESNLKRSEFPPDIQSQIINKEILDKYILLHSKKEQTNYTSSQLEKGKLELENRVVKDRNFYQQLFIDVLQKNWSLTKSSHSNLQQESTQPFVIDIAMLPNRLAKFRHIPIVVNRIYNSEEEVKKENEEENNNVIDYVIPSICTFGKKLVSYQMLKEDFKYDVQTLFKLAQDSVFHLECFETLYHTVTLLHRKHSSFNLIYFSDYLLEFQIDPVHKLKVLLVPNANDNLFFELRCEQNWTEDASFDQYLASLFKDSMLQIKDYIRQNYVKNSRSFGELLSVKRGDKSKALGSSNTDNIFGTNPLGDVSSLHEIDQICIQKFEQVFLFLKHRILCSKFAQKIKNLKTALEQKQMGTIILQPKSYTFPCDTTLDVIVKLEETRVRECTTMLGEVYQTNSHIVQVHEDCIFTALPQMTNFYDLVRKRTQKITVGEFINFLSTKYLS